MTINAWAIYIVAGAYALLLGALAIVLIVNADQRAMLAKDDAARSLLQTQNQAWAEKMAASDAALEKIKAADIANAKAIAKATAASLIKAKKLERQAASIGNLTFTGSDCDQITALGKAYRKLSP